MTQEAEELMQKSRQIGEDQIRDKFKKVYEGLLSGQSRSRALASAQRTLMKSYENPFYWGAFVLYGDYR